jgi:hypothetical protein
VEGADTGKVSRVARVRVGGVASCVLEGVKWWWEAGIVLAGVGGGGVWAWGRDCGTSCLGECGRAMLWREQYFSMGKGVWGSNDSRNQWGEPCSGGNRLGKGTGLAYCVGGTWEWVGVKWWHAQCGR